jgi:hypothetical protein
MAVRNSRCRLVSGVEPVTISATPALVTISFQLRDFDGEARSENGAVQFRLQDRDVPGDEGVLFARDFVAGHLLLSLEFDTPGDYVLTIEPPLPGDMQLAEPVRVKVD